MTQQRMKEVIRTVNKQYMKRNRNRKNQERKERRVQDDDISNQLYQAQNPFYSAFTFATNALYPVEKKPEKKE